MPRDRRATCTFEPIDATKLRMVVIEHDTMFLGSNEVLDIVEVDCSASRPQAIKALTRFIQNSGIGFDLAFKAPWSVDLGRTRKVKGILEKVLSAYPGADGCQSHVAVICDSHARADPVPF